MLPENAPMWKPENDGGGRFPTIKRLECGKLNSDAFTASLSTRVPNTNRIRRDECALVIGEKEFTENLAGGFPFSGVTVQTA